MPASLENSAVATGLEKVVFIPIPKKGNAKNVQTTELLHSFHMLARLRSKIFWARLQQYVNQELPDVQGGFRKGWGTRDQTANLFWIIEKAREFQKNICFIDYAKTFGCVDHNKLENSERDGNTRPPYLPPEKPVCRSRSNSLEPDMKQQTVSKLGKEYVKAICCHPAYLTCMHSTSCEMPS